MERKAEKVFREIVIFADGERRERADDGEPGGSWPDKWFEWRKVQTLHLHGQDE